MTRIAELKSQIEVETDAHALVALYEELVPLLLEPKPRLRDMSPAERSEYRALRRERRRAGLNLRTGEPLTEEEIAKRQALSAKLKGRTITDEQRQKLRDAAENRRQRQAAMEQRLKELEAIVAQQNGGVSEEASERRGRRR